MKTVFFTSSWDDGHVLDLKLADLLSSYNIKGTFYVPKSYKKISDLLSIDQIKKVGFNHEIGAHTLTHPDLDKLNQEQLVEEIKGSKIYFENILGKNVKMFCYPRGLLNAEVKKIVKDAGYLGARSTQKFCFFKPSDFFEFGVSVHMYPFPFRKKDKRKYLLNRHLLDPLIKNYNKIDQLDLPLNSYFSLKKLLCNSLDYASTRGEIFHLYGHSWEIERYGLWDELEFFLSETQKKANLVFLTNGECLQEFKKL